MFKLDNQFLQSLGLGALPVEEKNKLLQMIYERLEMNVGMRLAEKMTDAQLDEFESFIDKNDEAGALKWLETNFPNYKDVVAEELEKLKNEVGQAAPQILAASQVTAQASNPSVMPGQPQPQQPYQPNPMPAQPFQAPIQPMPNPGQQPFQAPPQPFQPPAQPMQPAPPSNPEPFTPPMQPFQPPATPNGDTGQPPAGFTSGQ